MEITEALAAIEEGWNETVKPALAQRSYAVAHNDLTNLSLTAQVHVREFAHYHHGIRWMANILCLS